MADHLFVLGYSGELSVKAKGTRNRFCERLVKNLAEGLRDAGIRFELERTWSRLYLRSPEPAAGDLAARIFGVRSVAPAERRRWATQDDLLRATFVMGGGLSPDGRTAVYQLSETVTDKEGEPDTPGDTNCTARVPLGRYWVWLKRNGVESKSSFKFTIAQ